jgi:hypothetical protein
MRDHSTPLFKELQASGNETVSITPSASTSTATFQVTGLPPVTGNMKNYAQGFTFGVTVTLDADAAGSAVSFDQLFKGMASMRLSSPWFGDVYPHQHTRGAVVGLLINPISRGYQMTQPARAQIPTNVDADYTLELYYEAPLAFECLKKPHETAQWVGFFDGGTFEAIIGTTTVFDGDYAGAVIKAPTTVRAWCTYLPSPDEALGVPFQWREREIVGGGTAPILKGVGQETHQSGIEQGAGLAGMFWLANQLGLNGPDGVDNFTSVEIPWRGQLQLRNMDPYFLELRRAQRHRTGPIVGLGTTIMADGGAWPSTMVATPNGRLGANADALFLPLVFPGGDFETSKAQRVGGDLQILFGVTAAITNPHRFVTWELLEYDSNQIARLQQAMGNSGRRPDRFGLAKNADASQLRYTRWQFV